MTARHYVEVVSYKGEQVVKRMGPMSERAAERVDSGVNINLNHEQFFTRIVQKPPEEPR